MVINTVRKISMPISVKNEMSRDIDCSAAFFLTMPLVCIFFGWRWAFLNLKVKKNRNQLEKLSREEEEAGIGKMNPIPELKEFYDKLVQQRESLHEDELIQRQSEIQSLLQDERKVMSTLEIVSSEVLDKRSIRVQLRQKLLQQWFPDAERQALLTNGAALRNPFAVAKRLQELQKVENWPSALYPESDRAQRDVPERILNRHDYEEMKLEGDKILNIYEETHEEELLIYPLYETVGEMLTKELKESSPEYERVSLLENFRKRLATIISDLKDKFNPSLEIDPEQLAKEYFDLEARRQAGAVWRPLRRFFGVKTPIISKDSIEAILKKKGSLGSTASLQEKIEKLELFYNKTLSKKFLDAVQSFLQIIQELPAKHERLPQIASSRKDPRILQLEQQVQRLRAQIEKKKSELADWLKDEKAAKHRFDTLIDKASDGGWEPLIERTKAAQITQRKADQAFRLAREELERLNARLSTLNADFLQKRTALTSKERFPLPFRGDTAELIAEQYGDLRMAQPDQSVNACMSSSTTIKPYQQLIGRLLHPESPYLGFICAFDTGAGKTLTGIYAVFQWFASLIALSRSEAIAPVLILVPNGEALSTWTKEFTKWKGFASWTAYDGPQPSGSADTQILILDANKQFKVVIHSMVRKLPPTATRLFDIVPQARSRVYGLETFDVHTHPAYKSLPKQEKDLLAKMVGAQKTKMAEEKNIIVPENGCVLVDEAHNLTNSREISKTVTDSMTCLAWSNALSPLASPTVKKIFFTATPFDTSNPTATTKLENMCIPADEDQTSLAFSGTWRRGLSAKERTDKSNGGLLKAIQHATAAENAYLIQSLFDMQGFWKSTSIKEAFQTRYAGVLFYITLDNDSSVAPQFSKTCTSESCVSIWLNDSVRPLSVLELEQRDIPRPPFGQLILVPMSPAQYKQVQDKLKVDRKEQHVDRNALVDTSDVKAKASVYESIGTRPFVDPRTKVAASPKLDVALQLMRAHPQDKFFLFAQLFHAQQAKTVVQYLHKHGNYELVDAKTIDKTSPKEWYANSQNKPKLRIIVFLSNNALKESVGAGRLIMLKERLLELWNDPKNDRGAYFQAFFGDRASKESLSLYHTKNVIELDEPANEIINKQSLARIKRNCSLANFPKSEWNELRVWYLLSIPPTGGGPVGSRRKPNRKAGLRENEDDNDEADDDALQSAEAQERDEEEEEEKQEKSFPLDSNETRTNEEYHYRKRVWKIAHPGRQERAVMEMKEALLSAAADCFLYGEYNGNTFGCFRGPSTNPSSSKKRERQQRLLPFYDAVGRFCIGANESSLTVELDPRKDLLGNAGGNINGFQWSDPYGSAEVLSTKDSMRQLCTNRWEELRTETIDYAMLFLNEALKSTAKRSASSPRISGDVENPIAIVSQILRGSKYNSSELAHLYGSDDLLRSRSLKEARTIMKRITDRMILIWGQTVPLNTLLRNFIPLHEKELAAAADQFLSIKKQLDELRNVLTDEQYALNERILKENKQLEEKNDDDTPL